jgi:DNA damage-binding protein 1
MRSLQLLMYKPESKSFELRARDFNPSWISACKILEDGNTFLAADNECNLFVTTKIDAASDEDRVALKLVGHYHLGSFINCFRSGSLVMRQPDSRLSSVPTVLAGGVQGSIHLFASLPKQEFDMLNALQHELQNVIRGVGGLSHAEYRRFRSPFFDLSWHNEGNFIDGDLVESLLELSNETKAKVLQGLEVMNLDADDIEALVEELARLH